MGVVKSKLRKKNSPLRLTSLPRVLIDQIWMFIPFDCMTKRCLSRVFNFNQPSHAILKSIWTHFQTMALAHFDRPEVQTMLNNNANVESQLKRILLNNKSSHTECILYFADRIGAAFIMQYRCTVSECLKNCITNHTLFQLFLFALTFCWQVPYSIELPILSEKQHKSLAKLLQKRHVEVRQLSFQPQNISLDVLKVWVEKVNFWNLNMVDCHLSYPHLVLLLKYMRPVTTKRLNLSANQLDDNCVQVIIEYITKHKHICIKMANNLFSANGQADILQASKARCSYFNELNIKFY